MSFEERWKAVVERYLNRVRNDEGLKAFYKKHNDYLKRLRRIETDAERRKVEILSEEVKKEFAK